VVAPVADADWAKEGAAVWGRHCVKGAKRPRWGCENVSAHAGM
jgi:hypothetical protein